MQPNDLGAARRGPASSDQSRRASRPASALSSPPGPARTGLHSGAARAAAAGAAAAHRGALQVVPGEAAAVPGQDVLQAHVHPAACRGGGEAEWGVGGLRGAGREAAARPGHPRGLCSPAGDREAPGASWPLTSGATWPAPRKTKERRCPWAGLVCFGMGRREAAGTAGSGPHRYRLCQLGLGGPPRPDLSDRSAGVCGSAIAQLTPSVSLFLSVMRFLEALGVALQPLYFEAGPKQHSEFKPPNIQHPRT